MKTPLMKRPAGFGLDRFRDEMSSLMESFFSDTPARMFSETSLFPPVDIVDGDKELLVKCEVPGLKPDDFKISVADRTLTIRGEKREEHTEENGYYRHERTFGSFVRSFTLPCAIESDKVDARYRDGILEIALPKSTEDRGKEIKVKVK